MSYELLEFKANWADELDVYAFYIKPLGFYEEFSNIMENYFKKNIFLKTYIGSNQSIKISKDNFWEIFTSQTLNKKEYEVLTKLFPQKEFGSDVLDHILDVVIDTIPEEDLKYYPNVCEILGVQF